ncbi:MAG: hypothetical protein JKY87_00400 [Mariprofundus sp.]|nr:hypothetical protein [Mariprofundus sp.]
MKIVSLMLMLMLCSCGATKVPFQPHLTHDVKSIEVAKIEVDRLLLIKRVNPLFLVMGSSGMVMDALVVARHASKYEERAGAVHQMSVNLFKKTLMQSLAQLGFQAHSSDKRFWDYFKPSQKYLRQTTDAILHIRLNQLGFWSSGIKEGYFPSLVVTAKLIDPVSREVLYSDRFAIGVDFTSVEMMGVTGGKAHILPLQGHFSPYKDFKTLLDNPEKSRDDLFKVIAFAVSQIMQGLEKPKLPSLLVFDPSLIKVMPSLPLSTQMQEKLLP